MDRDEGPPQPRRRLQRGEPRRVGRRLESLDAGVEARVVARPAVPAPHVTERHAAVLGDGVIGAAEAVPEDSQRGPFDGCRVGRIGRGVCHVQHLPDAIGVARIVERRSGTRFGRVPRARIDVAGVARAQVLPPHRPGRDGAGKEVIEHHAEVGDVIDLLLVVADGTASRQPAAEDVRIALHRHHGAEAALGSAGLIYVARGPTGRGREQRLGRLDQLEQVPPDPRIRLDETGGVKARSRVAVAETAE